MTARAIRSILTGFLVVSRAVFGETVPAEPPKDLFQYTLSETVRFRSPGSESTSSLRGVAEVAEERARLALERGTFPRTRAHVAVAEGKDLYLLDRVEKVYARAQASDLRDLFLGGESEEPGFGSFSVRDISVTLSPEPSGAAFEGRPLKRYRVSASWTDVLAFPGRILSVRNRASGRLAFCEGLEAARGPWDDAVRLFRVKGRVREALEGELSLARGLLVHAEVDGDSESSFEMVGGVEDTEPKRRPPTSSFRAERQVMGLIVRKATAEARAGLAIPSDFRSRSLDRLLTEPGPPR
jgi:hypothetical protein